LIAGTAGTLLASWLMSRPAAANPRYCPGRVIDKILRCQCDASGLRMNCRISTQFEF